MFIHKRQSIVTFHKSIKCCCDSEKCMLQFSDWKTNCKRQWLESCRCLLTCSFGNNSKSSSPLFFFCSTLHGFAISTCSSAAAFLHTTTVPAGSVLVNGFSETGWRKLPTLLLLAAWVGWRVKIDGLKRAQKSALCPRSTSMTAPFFGEQLTKSRGNLARDKNVDERL